MHQPTAPAGQKGFLGEFNTTDIDACGNTSLTHTVLNTSDKEKNNHSMSIPSRVMQSNQGRHFTNTPSVIVNKLNNIEDHSSFQEGHFNQESLNPLQSCTGMSGSSSNTAFSYPVELSYGVGSGAYVCSGEGLTDGYGMPRKRALRPLESLSFGSGFTGTVGALTGSPRAVARAFDTQGVPVVNPDALVHYPELYKPEQILDNASVTVYDGYETVEQAEATLAKKAKERRAKKRKARLQRLRRQQAKARLERENIYGADDDEDDGILDPAIEARMAKVREDSASTVEFIRKLREEEKKVYTKEEIIAIARDGRDFVLELARNSALRREASKDA